MRELRRLSELSRYTLHALEGDIGRIRQVFFDDRDWQVRYFVVRTGNWLLGRDVLLLPDMLKACCVRIINVSSIYALIGAKAEVAYSTAKAGVIGLTKAVAKEAGKDGVTVNAVLPGLTRTPTIETFMADKYKQPIINNTTLGRMGEAEEIASVVAFLASDEASFITATPIPVSGGWGI